MRIINVALVLLVPLGGVLAPVVAEDAKPVDYLPLKKGHKWTYKMEFMGQKLDIVQQVTKLETADGQQVASVESSVNGQVMATEQLSSSAKGLFRHSFNGQAVSPPMQLLRLPVKKGDTWESKFTAMGQEVKATCKVDTDEVTVPAGKHTATTVEVDTEIMGIKVVAKYWFAPDVGMVKQTFDIGGTAGTLELEKFEAAK